MTAPNVLKFLKWLEPAGDPVYQMTVTNRLTGEVEVRESIGHHPSPGAESVVISATEFWLARQGRKFNGASSPPLSTMVDMIDVSDSCGYVRPPYTVTPSTASQIFRAIGATPARINKLKNKLRKLGLLRKEKV